MNKQLFQTLRGAFLPAADLSNFASAPAYALSPKQALAQLAVTGCLNNTFYATADDQAASALAFAEQVDPAFVAKVARYARQKANMKDMPVMLLASLASRDGAVMASTFPSVVDSGKMLRNFVQVIRSGMVGRKSLGSRPKRLVQAWLNTATEKQLLNAAVGATPSLADVVKMVHPKPSGEGALWRSAWFAWLIGKPFDEAALPPITHAFEAFKRDCATALPDVPFQMLTAQSLTTEQWAQIARTGSWQMVRQNLNTFARHGVFADGAMIEVVVAKLRDATAIAKAKAMPYQLMAAFTNVSDEVPSAIREALQDAMEIALANVPALEGKVVVCPDVSGSMSSPVTGARGSATSKVRCIDVAALVSAALLRKNPQTTVLPFEQSVVKLNLNARDSVMTNAQRLAAIGGGGTNCSAPLAKLNAEKAMVDVVVVVSDNESWVDKTRHGATQTMVEWTKLKARNPNAKLICVDVQPYATTQAMSRTDILNVGGFSDEVFNVLARFAATTATTGDDDFWVRIIEERLN